MVPVRMEFDTAFGGVKGYLAELRGRGVDLHLMREEVPPQGSRPRIVHLLVSLRNHMRSLGRCAQPAD